MPEAIEQALAIDREIGYRQGEAEELNRIANLWIERGEIKLAVGLHTKALILAQQMGNCDLELRILASRAHQFYELEDWSRAAAGFGAAAALMETVRGGFIDLHDKIASKSDTRLIVFAQ